MALPSSLFTPTSFNWFGGKGGGNTSDWVDYNTSDLFQTMLGLNSTADPALHSGSLQPLAVDPAASSSVREKVALGYVMLQFKGDIGGLPLAVNTGVRVEDTNFTSSGQGQTVLVVDDNADTRVVVRWMLERVFLAETDSRAERVGERAAGHVHGA